MKINLIYVIGAAAAAAALAVGWKVYQSKKNKALTPLQQANAAGYGSTAPTPSADDYEQARRLADQDVVLQYQNAPATGYY